MVNTNLDFLNKVNPGMKDIKNNLRRLSENENRSRMLRSLLNKSTDLMNDSQYDQDLLTKVEDFQFGEVLQKMDCRQINFENTKKQYRLDQLQTRNKRFMTSAITFNIMSRSAKPQNPY